MGIIQRFFKVLGIRLEKDALGKDEVAKNIREILAINFRSITGENKETSISKISIEEFEKRLNEIQSGFIQASFKESEQQDIIALYPMDYIKHFLPVIKNTLSIEKENDTLTVLKLMDCTLGNISKLFYLARSESGLIDIGKSNKVRKSYAPGDKDGLLWAASSSSILAISIDKNNLFLLYNEKIEKRIRENLNQKAFAKAARGIILSEYDPQAGAEELKSETGIMLPVEKPKELIIGNFFAPHIAKFDSLRVRSTFKNISISTGQNEFAVRDGIWARISLLINESEHNLYYLISGISKNDFTGKFGDPNNFFKNLLKEILSFIKTNCPGLPVKSVKLLLNTKPDPAHEATGAILNAELILNYSRMEISVCCPKNFIDLLYGQFLKPWEYKLLPATPHDFLSGIVLLNIALFNKNVKTFFKRYKGELAYMPIVTTCIPFYELIDLIDDRDLRIIIQNLLIPKYSTGISKLFNIGIPIKKETGDTGRKKSKSLKVFQVAYDQERVKKFLPEITISDIEHQIQYSLADDFDSFNKSIMREIIKSIAADKITISHKTRYILINEIYDILNTEFKKQLNDLKEQGVPFKKMQKLPNNRLINFINRINNQDLCKIAIDTDNETNLLLNCMSKGRKRKFMDDLEYYKKLYVSAKLLPEDIINAKLKIDDLLDKEIHAEVV